MTKEARISNAETPSARGGFRHWDFFRVSSFVIRNLSRHPFPTAQAPFGDKASERERKESRCVPEGKGPRLHDGRMTMRQVAGEFIQLARRNEFPSCLFGNSLQQWDVRRQRTKLFGGQVRAPTRLGSPDLRADGIRNVRCGLVSARNTQHVSCLVKAQLLRRRLGLKPKSGRGIGDRG